MHLTNRDTSVQRVVLIHKDDLCRVHRIPNLLLLKHPASHVTFGTYGEVWDIKHRMYEDHPVMDRGGVLVLDDVVMMRVAAGTGTATCALAAISAFTSLYIDTWIYGAVNKTNKQTVVKKQLPICCM